MPLLKELLLLITAILNGGCVRLVTIRVVRHLLKSTAAYSIMVLMAITIVSLSAPLCGSI